MATPSPRQISDAGVRSLRGLGVTAREFEVLLLVADRLSNREIGERLSFPPRTVEKHVASLLAKTGTGDRVALIRHFQNIASGAAGQTDIPILRWNGSTWWRVPIPNPDAAPGGSNTNVLATS